MKKCLVYFSFFVVLLLLHSIPTRSAHHDHDDEGGVMLMNPHVIIIISRFLGQQVKHGNNEDDQRLFQTPRKLGVFVRKPGGGHGGGGLSGVRPEGNRPPSTSAAPVRLVSTYSRSFFMCLFLSLGVFFMVL